MFNKRIQLFRGESLRFIFIFVSSGLMFFLARMIHNEFDVLRPIFQGDFILLWFSAALTIVGLASLFFIRRILTFLILDSLVSFMPIILMHFIFFVVSTKQIFGTFSPIYWVTYFVILIIIFWAGLKQNEVAFDRARPYNLKSGSGPVDLAKGTWDMEVVIILDTPERTERISKTGYKWYFLLSSVASGFGLYLGRNITTSQNKILVAGYFFILTACFLYTATAKVNLILETIKWERQIGKKIMIKLIE